MNTALLIKQAEQCLAQNDYQSAHKCLISILQADKHVADAYFLLGIIASIHHNNEKAMQLFQQALLLAPDNAEYLAQLAKHFALENKHIQAKTHADQASLQEHNNALTYDTIGATYSRIGLHQLAVKLFTKAIKIKPENPTFHFNLASSLKFTGDFIGAKLAFETTIKLSPNYYRAYTSLASLGGIDKEYNHLKQLNRLNSDDLNSDDKLYLGHALAREYEALGEYQKAFHSLTKAKQAKRNSLDNTAASDKEIFASLQQLFIDNEFPAVAGHSSAEPIFVVGMPRSGTTLVERIISQHSDVTSAGELQHFGLLLKQLSATTSKYVIDPATINAAKQIDFQQLGKSYIDSTRVLTGKTPRFLDKMPLNFLYVGFILAALPNAKIICLDRNPLDTIVSNFRQLFAVNYSYYNYSYDLDTTTEYYLLFKELITLWQQKYADNFYVVNYERLVNSPAEQAKKLIDFCDLSWQDQCLDVHLNKSPVATASAVQVRSPINNKSVGNWQKYDFCLASVKTKLQASGYEIPALTSGE